MANDNLFTPERVEIQINRALETEREDLAADSAERLVQRVNAHFQPGDEYDLALKRVQQRLAHSQAEATAVSEKQEQPELLTPALPEQLRPGQFQTMRTGRTRGLLRPVSLLAAAALCVLLVGGALTLLSQAHTTLPCKSCLANHTQTPLSPKTMRQYYGVTTNAPDPTRGTTLSRFDPLTGATLWRFTTPAEQLSGGNQAYELIRGAQEVNGILYFQSTGKDGQYCYAVRASDGSLVWKYRYTPSGFIPDRQTIIANGKLYVVGNLFSEGQAILTALDLRTGKPAWQKTYVGLKMIDKANVSMEINIVGVAGTTLLAVQSQVVNDQSYWNLYGLNAQTGEKLWTKRFSVGKYEVPGQWLLEEGVFYLSTELTPAPDRQKGDSHIYALEAVTGKVIWTQAFLDSFVGLQVAQNTIYAAGFMLTASGVDAANIYALKTSDGSIIWQVHKNNRFAGPALTVANGEVYVILYMDQDTPDILLALNGSNGHQDWQYISNVKSHHLGSGDADEHYLYLGDNASGNILVFNLQTGSLVKTIVLKKAGKPTAASYTSVFSLVITQ